MAFIAGGTSVGSRLVALESAPGGGGGTSATATADGAITNGDKIILQSNGTVKKVTTSSSILATVTTDNQTSQLLQGSEVCLSVDPFDSNKMICQYRSASSNYQVVKIVTMSGTTLSFGAEHVLASTNSNDECSACFSGSQQNQVIAAWSHNDVAYVKAGTVSGTSISWGYNATVESGVSMPEYKHWVCSDHNSSGSGSGANRYLVMYEARGDWMMMTDGSCKLVTVTVSDDAATGAMGSAIEIGTPEDQNMRMFAYDPDTEGKFAVMGPFGQYSRPTVKVGTTSGTTMSIGSAQEINTGSGNSGPTECEYLESDKIVCSWRDSYYPSHCIATISGTSCTFGSVVTTTGIQNLTYHGVPTGTPDKFTSIGQPTNQPSPCTAKACTVSGTSISFGNSTDLFNPLQGRFNATSDRKTMGYVIGGQNSGRNISSFHFGSQSSNMTQTAGGTFLGIADDDYADTVTATIQLSGSVDDAQSGLTPGSLYYVQTDGSLATTPASPSVLAGLAISATELYIGGTDV